MATLTWRDVATPQVRAPDLTDSVDAITQGIAGLGKSVQAIADAPAQREQAQLAQELLITQSRGKLLDGVEQRSRTRIKEEEAAREKAALKEFGAAQSILEAQARETALKGKSYDDFLKSEAYLKLSPDAQAYGAAHLSDAFWKGDEARISRQQQAAQEARMRESLAIQRRESNARMSALERARKKDEDDAAKARGVTSSDPETNRALTAFRNMTLQQLHEATGFRYEDKSLAELAKGAGIEDYSEYLESFNLLNKERTAHGRPALPEGVMKRVLAGQSGKNSFPFSWINEVDQDVIGRNLRLEADTFDAALKQEALLRQMENTVAAGGTLTDPSIQALLTQRAENPARVAVPGKPGVSMPARAAAPTGFQIPLRSY